MDILDPSLIASHAGPIALLLLHGAAQILLGVLLADLISGVLHWWEDTYGDPRWPVIGRYVIEPNIRHHREPLAFTRASYLKRNRVVLVIAGLSGAGLFAAGWINAMTITLLLVGAHANEIHVWSHLAKRRRPALVRLLQEAGLILTPKAHWGHHSGRFDRNYCTVTNLLNPVLDRLRVFRLIEGVVEGATGVRPRDEMGLARPAPVRRRALSRARRFMTACFWRARRLGSAIAIAAFGRPVLTRS